jgi:hypothetical protein
MSDRRHNAGDENKKPKRKMKLKKTTSGYESKNGRFKFIKSECAASRNGCWKTAWRVLDNGKLVSDHFEESLTICKEIAESIVADEILNN